MVAVGTAAVQVFVVVVTFIVVGLVRVAHDDVVLPHPPKLMSCAGPKSMGPDF